MPDWNPNFPAVLGPEWLPTVGSTARVREPHPGWMQRFHSTTAETIDHVRLGAALTPAERARVWTLAEIIPTNGLTPDEPTVVNLFPTGTDIFGTWRTLTGSSSNLHGQLTGPLEWPGPVMNTGIRDTTGFATYRAWVDAADFGSGGQYQNARICRVAVVAVAAAAGGGFRPFLIELQRESTVFSPGGGSVIQLHGFGAVWTRTWGELNPSAGRPWLPSDIADFGNNGPWTVRVRSLQASAANRPTVYALALQVTLLPVENRSAVAVWHRPEQVGAGFQPVETQPFISLPDGGSGWAKPANEDLVLWWRQARAPSMHQDSVVASDVRWMLSEQDLGPGGTPPGPVYPLTDSGWPPAPDGVLAGDSVGYDGMGLPTAEFQPRMRRAAAFALVDDGDDVSPDSQPYQMGLLDLVDLTPGQRVGQLVTPTAPVTLLTARMVVIPSPLPGGGTLTIAVHRVSDGVRMGGVLAVGIGVIRNLPRGTGGLRYVEGHLTQPAELEQGVQYEIRASVSFGQWMAFMPNADAGPDQAFGDGALIGGTLHPNRTLLVNLLAQPDPPRDLTADIIAVPTTNRPCSVPSVEHVEVTWDTPEVPLGQGFARYDLERQLLRDVADTECEPVQPTMLDTTSTGSAASDAVTSDAAGTFSVQATIHVDGSAGTARLIGHADSWEFRRTSGGALVFEIDALSLTRTSTDDIPDGAGHLRVTFTPDDLDGNDITVFETSLDGETWEQLGATVTTGSGGVTIPAPSAALTVGGDGLTGQVHTARVRVAGITVAAPDFTRLVPGATQLEDSTGRLWTVTAPAAVVEDEDAAPISPDHPDCEWQQVATILDPSVRRFVDHEVPRGHAARYRARQVAGTGGTSEWVESGFAVPEAHGAEVIITSNQDPDAELVYGREPEQQIVFLSHEATEQVALYGSPLQVTFTDPDRRGRSAVFDLVVNFGRRPAGADGVPRAGEQAFAPLDDLTLDTSLPYLAVLDHDGNRWLGSIGLTTGTYAQPGHRYHVPVTVTPTHPAPIPVIVDTPD